MEKDYPPYLDYPKPRRTQTNGDRIRAMSDEKLAEFLCDISYDCECCPGWALCTVTKGDGNGVFKWLQQPAEGGDKG